MIWLFAFLIAGVDSEDWIRLETTDPLEVYIQFKTEVARDGSLLIMTPRALHHWDNSGLLINKITRTGPESGFDFIETFHYDPKRKTYWVIDGQRYKSYFYDAYGELLGQAVGDGLDVDPNKVHFRDLISVGGRIFSVTGAEIDTWGPDSEDMLQQLTYEKTPEGVVVYKVGRSFARNTELQREYSFNFKKFWIVQDGFSTRFFIADQFSRKLRIFSAIDGKIDNGLTQLKQTVPLYMPGWVAPPSRQNRNTSSGSDFHLFSQVIGLYPFKKDLIVGYTVPDGNEDSLNFALQRISSKGVVRGEAIQQKGLLMGVHQGKAYVYIEMSDENGKNYIVRKIDL